MFDVSPALDDLSTQTCNHFHKAFVEKLLMENLAAFDDEQLDADMQVILGPWIFEEREATANNANDFRPALGSLKGNISAAGVTGELLYGEPGTFSATKAKRGYPVSNLSGKALTSFCRSRPMLMLVVTTVVTAGLGMFGETTNLSGGRAPSSLQGKRDGPKISEPTSSPIVSNVAIQTPDREPINKASAPTQLKRVVAVDISPARKAGSLSAPEPVKPQNKQFPGLKQSASSSNMVAPQPSLVETPQDLMVSGFSTASQSSNIPEVVAEEDASSGSAIRVTTGRDRRDSVAALRALRKQ
jgi:hypothetical protein